MLAEKAKWYAGLKAPVMFMIDDLANKGVDINGNGIIDADEDWGRNRDSENSAFNFLTKTVLKDYENVKITFFVPLIRAVIKKDSRFKYKSGPIDETPELAEFFRRIDRDERYELAYHGLTHGISGYEGVPFIQEWESFDSLDEALKITNEGREYFRKVIGRYPEGGKYCGYRTNEFSDSSIDKSGFKWWCRKWNRGLTDVTAKEKFRINYFGENSVIDIPSTLAGNIFDLPGKIKEKAAVEAILGRHFIKYDETLELGYKQINELYNNGFLISVQQHISPARTDGKRQGLNIFDDIHSLRRIFSYLSEKQCWYATGTEVAEYFEAFEKTQIIKKSDNSFELIYSGKKLNNNFITIILRGAQGVNVIRNDSGTYSAESEFSEGKYLIKNFPLINGIYTVTEK